MINNKWHPSILKAVQRHKEFFEGKRNYLVKINIPCTCKELLETEIPLEGLDWENDYDEYVRCRVENGKRKAKIRLDLDIGDDYIPHYHPFFGISEHHSFFGGKVSFGGGTSYVEPVISAAKEWRQLKPNMNNLWIQRLVWGLDYCREKGDGILLSSYRGGNGPLDMANGVMGDNLFTECYDDPENMHKVMKVCTEGVLATFALQRKYCTEIQGGHIVPCGNLWVPGNNIGHVSLDAVCLAGPKVFEEFEKPYLNKIAKKTGGMVIHSHMMGLSLFSTMFKANGFLAFAPADDPKEPSPHEVVELIHESIGEVPLIINLKEENFADVLPSFTNKRGIFYLEAKNKDDAKRLLEKVDSFCPLQR